MSLDEHFLIHLDMIDDKNVEQSLKNIDYRLKEISEDLLNVGYGSKEVDVFTNEMKTLSSVTKSVASAVALLNKTNAQAAKDAESVALAHQKVATEAGKTARELEKAKTQAANTTVANQKLSTEMEKTAAAHARAEMAALRVAQAHEKQALKAQQAARPYNQLNQQLREQAQKLRDAIVSGNANSQSVYQMANEYNKLNARLREADKEFKKLTATKQESKSILDRLKSSFNTFIALLAHTGLTKGIQLFKDFASSLTNAGIELDALNNTMLAATGGWESGGKEIEWIIDMSRRLGLSFGDVSDSYAKFMTSFTRSGGTISQSRQIFEDLSAAMVSLHLPAERMQGVFVALEQMANKGTVQAEELKRQLSNALPGAFELAAESMGILPAKLMDLMKKGEVFSKDFLPAFAATVRAALGQSIDIASMQFNASVGRLTTNLTLLKMNVGQILNDALLPFLNGLVAITKGAADMAKSLNENRGVVIAFTAAITGLAAALIAVNFSTFIAALNALGATILTNTVVAIEALSVRLWALKGMTIGETFTLLMGTFKAFAGAIRTAVIPALVELLAEAWALNVSLGGLPLIIGAAVTGFVALGVATSDASKKASNITPYIGLGQQIVNLTKEVTTLDSKTEEGKQKLEEFKQSFPSLTQYLIETGKKFEELSDAELQHIAVLGEHDAKMRVVEERTKELASWQSTLSAACQVAWDNICKWSKILVNSLMDGLKSVIEYTKTSIKNIASLAKTVGKFLVDVGEKAGVLGVGIKTAGAALVVGSDMVLNFDSNLGKLKTTIQNTTKATTEWAKNTSFGVDVASKKISNANQNAIKKLEVVNKNAKTTYDSLKQAQSAVVGLQTGTGGGTGTNGGTGRGKSNSKGEKDKVKKSVSAWKDLDNTLKKVSEDYKSMLLNSDKYTEEQINRQKILLGQLKSESEYYKNIESREGVLKITNKAAKQLSDTLVDGIFEPLKEGETYWSRFKEAGLDALKSVAQALTKQFLQDIVAGFTAGWRNNQGNIFERFAGGLVGTITSVAGKPLQKNIFGKKGTSSSGGIVNGIWSSIQGLFGGGTSGGTMTGGASSLGEIGQSILGSLNNEAEVLSGTLATATTPAISAISETITGLSDSAMGAGNSLLGVANPALNTAQSMASMAVSVPIATASMGALSAIMIAANTAFTSAAPALIDMAGAMASLAASAGTAATSMAALAVATAAQSVAQIPFVGGFLAPAAALATGAAVAAGTTLTGAAIGAGAMMAGAGQMVGGAMSGVGNTLSGVSGLNKGTSVVPHAKGGIVSSPTMFPMQGGNIGLAGEAGTEVIAPARRMLNGEVGVGAVQPQVTVNNYTNAAVEVIKRPNNETEIKISELNAMLSSSRTNMGMVAAQKRLQKQGRQIG